MFSPEAIDELFAGDPREWIEVIPEYQKNCIDELLSSGLDYSAVAESWANASAENTYKFGAANTTRDKSTFLNNLKKEVRAYLCGDPKYKKERDGLFGTKGVARAYVVSSIAVTIAAPLGVAATVISPLVALVLASIGKVALNAWCALEATWSYQLFVDIDLESSSAAGDSHHVGRQDAL